MAAALRKVRSMEDIEFNFRLLVQLLANISPEQIQAGAINPSQINGDVMLRSGGGFTGDISAPNLSVSQLLTANGLEVDGAVEMGTGSCIGEFTSDSMTVGPEDDKREVATTAPADLTAAGLVKKAAQVADLNIDAGGVYTPAQIQAIADKLDALLSAMRSAGQLESPE